MFTVEHELDHSIVTIVDNDAKQEDVQVISGDENIFIRQWNDKAESFDVICLSPFMFREILTSLHYGEGVYATKDKGYD